MAIMSIPFPTIVFAALLICQCLSFRPAAIRSHASDRLRQTCESQTPQHSIFNYLISKKASSSRLFSSTLCRTKYTQHRVTENRRKHYIPLHESPFSSVHEPCQKTLFQELQSKIRNSNQSDQSTLLRLEDDDDTGYRGVYSNDKVACGDQILSVPLEKCLRDDEPPRWIDCVLEQSADENCIVGNYYNPSQWAVRLAASLIEQQLQQKSANDVTPIWLQLLPNPDFLRASLPIHWTEDLLKSAGSMSLELYVDSAYFARAHAVEDLLQGLEKKLEIDGDNEVLFGMSVEERRRFCENALDVVQTRSCRVKSEYTEEEDDSETFSPPIRVLAPVFDFLNHNHSPNAKFALEKVNESDYLLVVRALRDIAADEEVCIDYGGSTRPAWRCLGSYGFVPDMKAAENGENDDLFDEEEAEVYIEGRRYTVGPTSIPAEMVSAMAATTTSDFEQGEAELTPSIAKRLSKRISDVAYNILLDPWEGHHYDEDEDEEHLDYEETQTAEEILSTQIAASLRWHEHRILMKCSSGLGEWAIAQNSSP